MTERMNFYSFSDYGWHKGFYTDGDPTVPLQKIYYTDFFEDLNDDEFPFDTAYPLLCGSCNHFTVSLAKVLGYTPYIIEANSNKGFHAFCQVYKKQKWYYIDARGVTSSFNEFMDIAKTFVKDEYIIRPVNPEDIEEWEKDFNYNEEAYAFAEAIIEKYKECYIV